MSVIDELLLCPEPEFLGKAYQKTLGRQPDPQGAAHYQTRLRIGSSRIEVLADLLASPEARTANRPGLDELRELIAQTGAGLKGWRKWLATPWTTSRRLGLLERLMVDGLANTQALLGSLTAGTLETEVATHALRPQPQANRDSSQPTLRLCDDYSIDEPSWLAYLEPLYRRRLHEPLTQAGPPPPDATLWFVVLAQPASTDPERHATERSIAHLAEASEYPVLTIGTVHDPDRLDVAAIAGAVRPQDLVFFIHEGDEPRPEVHMALKLYGCFAADFCLVDMYYRSDGRIFPLLMHGVDDVHAKWCDYFHSRFAVRGAALSRLVAPSAGTASAREIALSILAHVESLTSGSRHVSLPLIYIHMPDQRLAQQRERVIFESSRRATCNGFMIGTGDSRARPAAGERARVTAVICTKDRGHLLRQLARQLLVDPLVHEIVLVSNNTSNLFALAGLDELARLDRVRVLAYDRPFNFSAQCNLGARHSSGELVLFINDDIVPVREDWLVRLVEWFDHAGERIVGPLLLYPDETVQHGGMFIGFNGVAGHTLRHARIPSGDYNFLLSAPRRTSCLTGAVILMRRRLFDQLNGFDVLLASYLQDVDLSLRALFSGAELIFDPRSILLHMESISIKQCLGDPRQQRARENEYRYFLERWATELGRDRWMSPLHSSHDESLRTLVVPQAETAAGEHR
jgi:GT2 family glycosyltransferase